MEEYSDEDLLKALWEAKKGLTKAEIYEALTRAVPKGGSETGWLDSSKQTPSFLWIEEALHRLTATSVVKTTERSSVWGDCTLYYL